MSPRPYCTALAGLAGLACFAVGFACVPPPDDPNAGELACGNNPTYPEAGTSEELWVQMVGENAHYRYTFVDIHEPSGEVAGEWGPDETPSGCVYTTTIEVDAGAVIGRALTIDVYGPMPPACDEPFSEGPGEIGTNESDWAAPARTIDALYQECCGMIIGGGGGYFYADNDGLLSYCGDDYCDDGGCQTGSGPDIRVDTIEFL